MTRAFLKCLLASAVVVGALAVSPGVAANAVGSAPTASISVERAAGIPRQMVAPVVVSRASHRDGRLRVEWTAPGPRRPRILGYDVRTDGNAAGLTIGPRARTVVVAGLENGRTYRFSIRAFNRRGSGPWSHWSAPDAPFTVPSIMPAPTLTAVNDNGDGEGFVTVEWNALLPPRNGFDPITRYTVRLLSDGAPIAERMVGGDKRAVDFAVENGHSYTATVRARNRAGDAANFSAQATARISWDRARAVTAIINGGDCPDNKCAQSTSSYFGKVNFTTPADDGGYPVTHYRYTTSAGTVVVDAPTTASGASTSLILPFANAATGQTVTLVPITHPPGEGTTFGATARGGNFNPYALPPAPTVTGLFGGYRTVGLSFNCSSGNGRAVDQVDVSKDSGGSVSGCQIAWAGDEVEGGTTKCATVRVHNAAGWSATSSRACATSDQKQVDVSVEAYAGNPPGPCTQNCDAIRLTIGGFRGGTTYGYTSNIVASDGSGTVSGSLTTGGDGRGTKYVAYYDRTVYDETYCVNLNGLQACAQGR